MAKLHILEANARAEHEELAAALETVARPTGAGREKATDYAGQITVIGRCIVDPARTT